MSSYCQCLFYFLLQLLLADFEKCKTWEEKLDIFLSHVPNDKVSLSMEDTKTLCTTIYMYIFHSPKVRFVVLGTDTIVYNTFETYVTVCQYE